GVDAGIGGRRAAADLGAGGGVVDGDGHVAGLRHAAAIGAAEVNAADQSAVGDGGGDARRAIQQLLGAVLGAGGDVIDGLDGRLDGRLVCLGSGGIGRSRVGGIQRLLPDSIEQRVDLIHSARSRLHQVDAILVIF